jgi:hypothetical protein
MKHAFWPILVCLACVPSLRAQTGLSVAVAGGEVSVAAERALLVEVLAELDRQAGTQTTLPSELEGELVTTTFEALRVDAAVAKIVEGLALDYAVVGGRDIVVLGRSKAVSPRAPAFAESSASGSPLVQPSLNARRGANNGEEAAAAEPSDPAGSGRRQAVILTGQPAPGILVPPSGAETGGPGGRTTPFGVPLDRGAQGSQPFQSILGNAPPTILDLTRPEDGLPPVARPLPGMPTAPQPTSR